MEGFGRRLENFREKFGYSKRDVSRKLEFSENVYGSYEREERRPSFETIIKLADIYNVSLDYLILGEEFQDKDHQITNEDTLREIIKHFKDNCINEPYILEIDKWKKLSSEDLIELTNHFEWVVHKAKIKKR